MRVFLDSSVIIAAVKGSEPASANAVAEIGRTDAEFVSCSLVVLETVARMRARGFGAQAQLAEKLLNAISIWVPVDDALVFEAEAVVAAAQPGLATLDALLLATARRAKAEFVTCEKPSKPLFGIRNHPARSLHPEA